MKRKNAVTIFLLFLASVAVFMAFGPQIRAALPIEAVVLWYIGLALGIIGTIMVFWDRKSDE